MDTGMKDSGSSGRLYSRLLGIQAGAQCFTEESPGGYVQLVASVERCRFCIEDEADVSQFISVCKQAQEAGFGNKVVDTLIDMTTFVGSIDWSLVGSLADLIDFGHDRHPKIAYIFNQKQKAVMLKIFAAMFPAPEHKAFANETDAMAWLGWQSFASSEAHDAVRGT